jgi:hypothetical protein
VGDITAFVLGQHAGQQRQLDQGIWGPTADLDASVGIPRYVDGGISLNSVRTRSFRIEEIVCLNRIN